MTPSISTSRSWHLLGMTPGVVQCICRTGMVDGGPSRIDESKVPVSWSKHTLLT